MANNWNSILSNTNNLRDVLIVLQKVLALLDNKVDSTVVDEALNNIDGMSEELQQALNDLLNNDFMEPFSTETALLASRPTITKKAAKALDTKKVWLWDGTQWNDTGLSEKDLAIAYSNEIALSVNEQTSAEFHNSDETSLEIPLIVSNGNVLLAINGEGEVLNPAPRSISFEFHNSDESPSSEYIETDENGFIIRAKSKSDADLDTSKMQLNEKDLNTGAIYKSNNILKVVKDYPVDLYETTQTDGIFKSPTTIYDFLDQLVFENPDYITKSDLGTDAWGNVISQYTLTCPRFHRDDANDWTNTQTKPPKILLMSGTHGGLEKEAVITTVLFMHELINKWRESEILTQLRWAADIVIIPLLNPSGYIAGTRENGAGVDLNRDGIDLSQIETQIAVSLPSLHPDCNFFVDHHNSYAFGQHNRPFWIGFLNQELLTTFSELARKASCYLRREFGLYDQSNEVTARLSKGLSTTIATNWTNVSGRNGVLVETPRAGGTSIISLKNRRIHNLNCILMTLDAIRDYQVNKLIKGEA